MAEVVIEGLRKSFSKHEAVQALAGVDLDVDSGELLVLLGPSGCGKSTLLRCVAGLERPDSGTIRIARDVVTDIAAGVVQPPNRRDIGMVFQNYVLWPHMTVARNVAYPLQCRHRPKRDVADRAHEVLRIVQCDHLAKRYPGQLSGGQQQRVALARALVSQPAVLLLDEPLSNLDALLRVELRAQLRQIHNEIGYTGIYVTHDQNEALNLGTRVAVMRSGHIEQVATPQELYAHPRTDYVAAFLGARNRLSLRREDGHWHAGSIRLGMEAESWLPHQEAELTLFLRPEALQLAPPAASAPDAGDVSLGPAFVRDAIYGGDQTEYVVDLDGSSLFVKEIGARGFDPGSNVRLVFHRRDALLYRDGVLIDTDAADRVA